MLRSKLGEGQRTPPSRSAHYFEAHVPGTTTPIFGEALAFFEVVERHELLVIYHPFIALQPVLRCWRGSMSNEIHVLPASALHCMIGIWIYNTKVWILRKHPGLALLTAEERVDEHGASE